MTLEKSKFKKSDFIFYDKISLVLQNQRIFKDVLTLSFTLRSSNQDIIFHLLLLITEIGE